MARRAGGDSFAVPFMCNEICLHADEPEPLNLDRIVEVGAYIPSQIGAQVRKI